MDVCPKASSRREAYLVCVVKVCTNKSYTPWREGPDGRQIQFKSYMSLTITRYTFPEYLAATSLYCFHTASILHGTIDWSNMHCVEIRASYDASENDADENVYQNLPNSTFYMLK